MRMCAMSCCRIHSLGIYSTQGGGKVKIIVIHYPHVLFARHSSLCLYPLKLRADKAALNQITSSSYLLFVLPKHYD